MSSLPYVYCITPIGKNENAIGFISKSNAADTLITYETEIKYSDQIIGTIKERGQRFYMAQFGKLKMISFFAKRARGMMARYIIQNKINEGININLKFDP